MSGLFGGIALLVLALFMFAGYLSADIGGAAAMLALGITVVLPGAAGAMLVSRHMRRGGALAGTREDLRRQTLEAELLRLAAKRGGKLTIVEAVTDLAVSPDEAKTALDALSVQGIADFEVTDSGVVVYVFHDVQRLGDKSQARGLLE